MDKRTKTEYIIVPNALILADFAYNWGKSGLPLSSVIKYEHAAKYRERIGEILDSVIMSVEWEE